MKILPIKGGSHTTLDIRNIGLSSLKQPLNLQHQPTMSIIFRVFGILAVTLPGSWSLLCPTSTTYAVTGYLHYPTPQDCNVLSANYAASQCNYHCRQACAVALGLPAVPDISVVGSVNVKECLAAAQVPGYSTGTVIKVEMCCEPSQPCDADSTHTLTPYIHHPTQPNCNVLTANYGASQCNYHCRLACKNALGLSAVPDISMVGSATVQSCQTASQVAGFTSSPGTVVTMDVCCEFCGANTYKSTTSLLYYGAGSTCTNVRNQINGGSGCGYHCYAACGGPRPYNSAQFGQFVNSMRVEQCDDSDGQAKAVIEVCCNYVTLPPQSPARGDRVVGGR